MAFQWPSTSQRLLVLGSTGSGKSIFAAHVLSNAPITRMPYVIVDYKREKFLAQIPRVKYLDFKDMPREPGVYILSAEVVKDDDRVEQFLRRVHARERMGLFLDEGFMMPHKPPYRALNAIYTQGRSKHIPVITLTQRPVWISRFAYSEADHVAYLRLSDRRDRKMVAEFTPDDPFWNLSIHPERYHVKWYDVGQNRSFHLLPAPKPAIILQKFEDRLAPEKRIYL